MILVTAATVVMGDGHAPITAHAAAGLREFPQTVSAVADDLADTPCLHGLFGFLR